MNTLKLTLAIDGREEEIWGLSSQLYSCLQNLIEFLNVSVGLRQVSIWKPYEPQKNFS